MCYKALASPIFILETYIYISYYRKLSHKRKKRKRLILEENEKALMTGPECFTNDVFNIC